MFFLRRIYVVFFAFFPIYQYAMKEKIDEDNIDNNKENNKQNNEQNNEVKDENSLEKPKIKQSKFTFIFSQRKDNLYKKLEKELEEYKKDNPGTAKYEEECREVEKIKKRVEGKFKEVEKYLSEIDARVEEKHKEINEEIEKEEKKRNKKTLCTLGETMMEKFDGSLKRKIEMHANILLGQRVMCYKEYSFPFYFNQFKEEIDKKINEKQKITGFLDEEELQRAQLMNDFKESEWRRSRLYKFFRNALYRQAYLLFYNTARVISNVKIEYDLWHSDTWKHIWGFNSSANVYYKYRSAWNYRVFKFNLFYIEFSFGLFHLLLKPLKRIAKIGSVLSYGGGDYFKKIGLDASEIPFWDMINISLVQISVGPVKINGLRFSLFDPIFFVMSLCLAKYLGLSDYYFSQGYMKVMFRYLSNYDEIISLADLAAPKIYNLKELLKKFNFVTPGSYSAFIKAFSSYLFKKSILFNIIETWKIPYFKGFRILNIVFYTFVGILKSAPEIFKEILNPVHKPFTTIHENKIIETHYLNSCVYTHDQADACSFRGRCDLFFLSLAILVYSMIDSISIDLRWIIENESVRKYCVKLKREVCKFFKK